MSFSSTSNLPARDAAHHLLARVRTAREAGLDTMTFGDSHTRDTARYFQNTPTVGRALAEWDPQRPAGCLFLVPMWPPVLLAEQVGTLAALHDGPFIVQTGLGGGPTSFARFGVDVEHRGNALDESIRVVKALFAGETVSSAMFGIVDAHVDLVPPDGVEWWIGTMSDAGVERAAKLGAVWYAMHGAIGDELDRMVAMYRDACDRHGSTPTVAVRREAIVLNNGDRARNLRDHVVANGFRGMTSEMIVAGTVEDVAELLAPLDAQGVDEVMMRTIATSTDDDLETIELLGQVRSTLTPSRSTKFP
jgi:alkanesulfonate monooxygenase SsuD/methylene tetrahydromethanopterin reductase-like flavin-dependent oxidoreductase (luciferase family)